jgi:hypothetical protein
VQHAIISAYASVTATQSMTLTPWMLVPAAQESAPILCRSGLNFLKFVRNTAKV